MDLVFVHASLIVHTTPLPVSIDIERGYEASTGEVPAKRIPRLPESVPCDCFHQYL